MTLLLKVMVSLKILYEVGVSIHQMTNLGRLYMLPKIHKRIENVPRRPVISNCGTLTEKVLEVLDCDLKPVTQSGPTSNIAETF